MQTMCDFQIQFHQEKIFGLVEMIAKCPITVVIGVRGQTKTIFPRPLQSRHAGGHAPSWGLITYLAGMFNN